MVYMCIFGIYVPFEDNNDAHMAGTTLACSCSPHHSEHLVIAAFCGTKITKHRECLNDISGALELEMIC